MAFTTIPAAGGKLRGIILSALITELRPVTASKGANTSRTSTASRTADPDLVVALEANATYDFEYVGYASSAANAAGDISCEFSYPTGATYSGIGIGPHNSLASGSQVDGEYNAIQNDATSPSGAYPFGCSTAVTGHMIKGRVVVGSTAGNLTLLWAQQSSNASATSLLAGSTLTVRRVV